MAKRGAIIDMGRHKAVGSSWKAMDTLAFSRSYEPETRLNFRVYVTGQADACLALYYKEKDKAKRLSKIDIFFYCVTSNKLDSLCKV